MYVGMQMNLELDYKINIYKFTAYKSERCNPFTIDHNALQANT